MREAIFRVLPEADPEEVHEHFHEILQLDIQVHQEQPRGLCEHYAATAQHDEIAKELVYQVQLMIIHMSIILYYLIIGS